MVLPLIAVAGGSSQLGRAIVTAVIDAGVFQPIVLSRETSKTPAWLKELKIEVRRVDYMSETSCLSALDKVHTLISTLLCQDGTWFRAQKTLLDAGLKAGLKRFVASDFGIGPTVEVDLFTFEMHPIRKALRAAAEGNPGFEWTAFHNGLFCNYLGYGCENEEAAGLNHSFLFNVKEMTANVPVRDDGSLPDISVTTMADVGRFTAAACELEVGTWPEESYFAGQTLNIGEVIKIIEEVRGAKVAVTKHTKESLQEEISKIPADSLDGEDIRGRFFLQLTLAFADGELRKSVMPQELNKRFPHIQTTSVEEYMQKYWGEA